MQTFNYQDQVIALESKREATQIALEVAMDHLIATTLRGHSRLDSLIIEKINTVKAKGKRLGGIEGQIQAKRRENSSLLLEIQTLHEVEIPFKEKDLLLLEGEKNENKKQHARLLKEYQRITEPNAMFLSLVWNMLTLGRHGLNKAKDIIDRQREMAALKKRRENIETQLLPRMEREIQDLFKRIKWLEIRLDQSAALANELVGKRDELGTEIQTILRRNHELESQKASLPEVQPIDHEVTRLKRNIEQINEDISHLLDIRRAEILALAKLYRNLIGAPDSNTWCQIEALLIELHFIQKHHP